MGSFTRVRNDRRNKLKRKLTTIFCADVQSYSALMARDEADTLQRLQRYRAIMAELFERHDGRKVNTWGDAVIAEFGSVVEAVRCGVEIQDAISAENRDLPQDKQMWFRIGINLGDVMQDGTDLYGDGVNVASRLELLADPGGIMVSETVYDLTHRQLSFAYDFAGEQKVKGQDNPIAGYRVRMPGSNTSPETDADAPAESPYTRADPAAFGTRACLQSRRAAASRRQPFQRVARLVPRPAQAGARTDRHDRAVCDDQPAHLGLQRDLVHLSVDPVRAVPAVPFPGADQAHVR